MFPTKAVIVYQLRRDKQRIEAVQRATMTTRKFGIMPAHGLFGSDEWWQKIESGKLSVRTVSGVITRLFLGGMRGTPEFTLRTDNGDESNWLRQANSDELDDFYAVERRIEIDYVLQRHRLFSEGFWPKQHPVVIEIRIGGAAP